MGNGSPDASITGDLPLVDGDYIISPGMIDAHNHVQYNIFPRWEIDTIYKNRYQWPKEKEYDEKYKKPYSILKKTSFKADLTKYGEVKALIAGTTMIQGSPKYKANSTLIRNVEHYTGLGPDKIGQSVMSVSRLAEKDKNLKLKLEFSEGKLKAYLVHLAEGVDQKSLDEFTKLEELDLVLPQMVIIHGTALGDEEFRKMGKNGMSLVWSPRSNMALYGKTTDISSALKNNVRLALACDWSISGSNNLLEEIRYADSIDNTTFGDLLSFEDLIRMVTLNPALILGFEGVIGMVREGFVADLVVFRRKDPDPFRSISLSSPEDVALVMVAGDPLYGDRELMERLGKKNDNELLSVGGVLKGLDVTIVDPEVAGSEDSFKDIYNRIKGAYPDLAPLAPGVSLVESGLESAAE